VLQTEKQGNGDGSMGCGKRLMILDMDGVVLDSEPLHKEAREIMMEHYGVTGMEDLLATVVGKSMRDFWAAVKERMLPGIDPDAMEREHYLLVARLVGERPGLESRGLREILRWAKDRGMRIALASSSLRVMVDEVLRCLDLTEVFDITVAGDEVAHKKPEADIYKDH